MARIFIPGRQCVLIGEQSLMTQCGQLLLEAGFELTRVVTENQQCCAWAQSRNLEILSPARLVELEHLHYDLMLSITNLKLLPKNLFERPGVVAINFHDGPLPMMRGLNTPMWALLQGHQNHAIHWHVMTEAVDRGDIITTETIDIDPTDTALTLNAKCYASGLSSFETVIDQLKNGALEVTAQPDEPHGALYLRTARPLHLGLIHPGLDRQTIDRILRALDTGPYENPLAMPKVMIDQQVFGLSHVELTDHEVTVDAPKVQRAERVGDTLVLTLRFEQFELVAHAIPLSGEPVVEHALVGQKLHVLSPEQIQSLADLSQALGRAEPFWVRELREFEPASWSYAVPGPENTLCKDVYELPLTKTGIEPNLAVLAYFARLADQANISALLVDGSACGDWRTLQQLFRPLTLQFGEELLGKQSDLAEQWNKALITGPMSADLAVRYGHDPLLSGQIHCCVSAAGWQEWLQSSMAGVGFWIDPQHCLHLAVHGGVSKPLEAVGDEINFVLSQVDSRPFQELELVGGDELAQLQALGRGPTCSTRDRHVVTDFRAQLFQKKDRVAVVCGQHELSYHALDQQALAFSAYLRKIGVKQGDRVGLAMPRSIYLMPAMLGILYAGAGFVPMDPNFPQDRLSHMAIDGALELIVCEQELNIQTPVRQIVWETVPWSEVSSDASPMISDGLAYMIYTSGSTGLPKGVMVHHPQLTHFCLAMDKVIPLEMDQPAWLAVTSISFDISILELLWTLTRGMKLVIYSGADLSPKSQESAFVQSNSYQALDFSLFYWNMTTEEETPGAERYQILFEGAKYADLHGFKAVWTPERHFGEFGGLYPNPSISAAAVAAITKQVHIRAGSCVVPLHHPIRIAEEWAMVDNMSDGRVGLSAAAGWMPNDFVIMPGNFENAKENMFDSLDQVRRLWRGESVEFSGPRGPVTVKTLPRPVQAELPVWVTTAGNPDNFRRAGQLGLNLLTHLLGQTQDELAEKIKIYQQAWTEAGHPGQGHVSLMLHTFVAETDEQAKEVARQPMKNYLKTALFLVKNAAWEFPTFKKMSESQGQSLDDFFANISDHDMDALLDFAFERYFNTAGLFGSVERCLKIADELKGIGVNEIGCLIDYGIATARVLAHLPLLKQVMDRCQPGSFSASSHDQGIAELIQTQKITHLQCTPSMARLLVLDQEIHEQLSHLKAMLVGGEALPIDLAQTLQAQIQGPLLNMYGPTETTIWSSVAVMNHSPEQITLGSPIANTQLVVVNTAGQPVPLGVTGELLIGGEGVVPGYWQRPELTAARFIQDQLGWSSSGRWYRTGDLVRMTKSGQLFYLGRNDFQVKIRGYRIELGEIESKILQMPQIEEAVVQAVFTSGRGEPKLVAYYIPKKDQTVDQHQIKDALHSSLPDYMMPSVFIALDMMPLTPNGKIDRKRLPAPQKVSMTVEGSDIVGDGNVTDAHAVPETDLEHQVLAVWKRVLELDQLSVTDNFFEKGGHSLLVVDMIAQLKPLLNKPVRLVDFFRFPTVSSLVAFLTQSDDATDQDATVQTAQSRGAARRAARRGR